MPNLMQLSQLATKVALNKLGQVVTFAPRDVDRESNLIDRTLAHRRG